MSGTGFTWFKSVLLSTLTSSSSSSSSALALGAPVHWAVPRRAMMHLALICSALLQTFPCWPFAVPALMACAVLPTPSSPPGQQSGTVKCQCFRGGAYQCTLGCLEFSCTLGCFGLVPKHCATGRVMLFSSLRWFCLASIVCCVVQCSVILGTGTIWCGVEDTE